MALDAGIGRADDLLARLVDALVALVAVGDRQLGAFLDIDDEGHGQPCAARPGDARAVALVAHQIAAIAHVRLLLLDAPFAWVPAANKRSTPGRRMR
jgi:hypothetical protein